MKDPLVLISHSPMDGDEIGQILERQITYMAPQITIAPSIIDELMDEWTEILPRQIAEQDLIIVVLTEDWVNAAISLGPDVDLLALSLKDSSVPMSIVETAYGLRDRPWRVVPIIMPGVAPERLNLLPAQLRDLFGLEPIEFQSSDDGEYLFPSIVSALNGPTASGGRGLKTLLETWEHRHGRLTSKGPSIGGMPGVMAGLLGGLKRQDRDLSVLLDQEGLSEGALDEVLKRIMRNDDEQTSGSAPPKEEAEEEDLEEVAPDDDPAPVTVQGRVFSREAVKAGKETLVQFVVHLPDQVDAVRANAIAADPKTAEQTAKTLGGGVVNGDQITAHLQIRGAEIDMPLQHQTWDGDALVFDFGVYIAELGFEELMAKIIVSRNGDAFGSLRWMIAEASAADPDPEPTEQARIETYKKAFLSYSSKDRAEVLKRAQGMRAMNIEVFLDRFSLVPGQKFEDYLDKNIKGADLFVLCWSKNANASEWVRKETIWASDRHALAPEHKPDLTAVILEQNPPPPPPEFGDRHMTDVLNDMIVAAEELARQRRAELTADEP